MKYEIKRDKDNLNLKLGLRYNVSFPKDSSLEDVVQIVNVLVETVAGINAMKIVEDILTEQKKDG